MVHKTETERLCPDCPLHGMHVAGNGQPAFRTERDVDHDRQNRLIVALCMVGSFLLIALVSLIGAIAGTLPVEIVLAILAIFSSAMAGVTWWYFRYKEPRS